MRKSLSLALVVAMLLTCVTGVASASEVYVAVSPGIAQCVEDIYASFVAAGGGELVFVKEATGQIGRAHV